MSISLGIGIKIGGNGGGNPWDSYFSTRTPTGLVLTVLSDTSVQVDWTDAAEAGDGLKVYFNDVLKDTVAFGVETSTVAGLTAGTTYIVEVVAYKDAEESNPITDAVTISTLLSNLIFSLKWDGSQFINAVTGLAMVDHGSVAAGTPVVANSAIPGVFVTANSKYLSTPDTVALSMGDIDFMAAVWCNITDTNVSQNLVAQYLSAGDQRSWSIAIFGTDRKAYFQVTSDGTSGTFLAVGSGVLANSTNYFILAWHNATANTINIQVNNGTIYSVAHTTGVKDSSGDFTVGAIANPGGYAGGLIGNVDVWKGRLLNATEKALLWSGGTGNCHPFDSVPSKVLIMGDKTGGEDVTISQAVNTLYEVQDPHLIIGVGDYDGNPATMAQLLTNLTTPKFSCPGNHDDWTVGVRTEFNANFNGGGYRIISIPYVDFFLYDFFLKMDETGYNSLQDSYTVSLANRQASTQGQWLIAQLAASTAKWKVVVFHTPAWASPIDYGGDPADVVLAAGMQWDWYALGADLILSGHYHFYERLLKNTGGGNVPIIICGTAGNTTDTGRLSADADSKAYFSDITDSDFAGAHLIIMTISSTQLQINLSGIDASYAIHTGKDQLVLT